MDIDGDAGETSKRVQVRFVTKLQPPFKVPATSIAIPSTLTRMGLSTIVNNLLQSGTFSKARFHILALNFGFAIASVCVSPRNWQKQEFL